MHLVYNHSQDTGAILSRKNEALMPCCIFCHLLVALKFMHCWNSIYSFAEQLSIFCEAQKRSTVYGVRCLVPSTLQGGHTFIQAWPLKFSFLSTKSIQYLSWLWQITQGHVCSLFSNVFNRFMKHHRNLGKAIVGDEEGKVENYFLSPWTQQTFLGLGKRWNCPECNLSHLSYLESSILS